MTPNPLPIAMSHRPTVHWIFPMPTPYAQVIFSALQEADFLDLLVHYSKEKVVSHPWKTNLRKGHTSRTQKPLLGIDWFLIKEVLFNKDAFFVGGWSGATLILIIIICVLLKRKFVFETDTPNIHKKRTWLFATSRSLFLRVGFRWAGYAIFQMGDVAAERLQKMGAQKEKLIYFPYWVDVEAFKPTSDKKRSTDLFLRFVSVGRVINERKGHDLAIRVLAMVYKQNKTFNFEYCILGTGPDVEKLSKLAEELGVAEKVKLMGWVEPDELKKIFHGSDLLIHPSPVEEPYGVAVIEAMAASLVVLASDVTFAALDRIEDGVNGFIYKANDVEELTKKINWCFGNKDKLTEIGNLAKLTANAWHVNKGVEIIKGVFNRSQVSA